MVIASSMNTCIILSYYKQFDLRYTEYLTQVLYLYKSVCSNLNHVLRPCVFLNRNTEWQALLRVTTANNLSPLIVHFVSYWSLAWSDHNWFHLWSHNFCYWICNWKLFLYYWNWWRWERSCFWRHLVHPCSARRRILRRLWIRS